MNIKLSDKQIEQIAEDLDCGEKCFYNIETKEVKSIIDTTDSWDLTDEYKAELAEIEGNQDNYFEFKKMDSRSFFLTMEAFISEIPDERFRNKLVNALNKPKPFRNFKIEIDKESDYRQSWFDFKKQKMIEWVKDQIEDFHTSNLE